MQTIKGFLAAHKISAKTTAAAWVFVTGLWAFSPDFRTYVLDVYAAIPHWAHNFIAGVIIPGLIFWKSRKEGV
jgi:hypothetical protein